ncbi:glycoside hydrolase family 140 protein [Mucilaginibacter sabulilitoris]|uniref:Glycoside hydrolase family 140 protein n=1 Tax=Mucilaginibacter sabulilitoris TaxID=1173583 RepID=A0ABZ0TQ22_9SPHI|nr:glycoside hydrolase family 140 protein [Mucilaginibacter sabulilitoris]WPU93590.1 glycoside hydrolase family 140 protein [Mucilaginibacter sabulilitoris]
MRKILFLIVAILLCRQANAQFSVSADKHYLLKDGKPFFWMGDTAWVLFARLTREEADTYLKTRSEQGFTVIQAVASGLHSTLSTNVYGEKPLINDDPSTPNEKYFEMVDYVIDKAEEYHLNVALFPTWASGPQKYNETNAAEYGAWIGTRYKNRTNVIWILGGDNFPEPKDIPYWHAMGTAIMKATDGKAVISYHAKPNNLGSAEWFRNEPWFSFNVFQNGHCRDEPIYDKMSAAYKALPIKPEIDAEPIYEDHPVCFDVHNQGITNAYDVRSYAYLDLFAGAFGHTYGCHDVWQMYSPKHESINGAHYFWYDALKLPGAEQMKFVRQLMESHPITDRVPDQSLIVENNYFPADRVQATRGKDYIFVYTASGRPFTVIPASIKAIKLNAYWFDPRTGKVTEIGIIANAKRKFTPPSTGYNRDWVLVLDDPAKNYKI